MNISANSSSRSDVVRFDVPPPSLEFVRLAQGVRQSLGAILTPITAFGELLGEDPLLDSQALSDVSAINEASIRAGALMERLLKAAGCARVDSAEMTVLDLAELVEQAWDTAGVRARVILAPGRGSEHTPEQADLTVIADARLIAQIIHEVSSNSVKAGAQNVLISVGVDEDTAVLRVSDDGTGSAVDLMPLLSEAYYSSWNGDGLGLSVVNGIATSLKGAVVLETDTSVNGFSVEVRWPQNGGSLVNESTLLEAELSISSDLEILSPSV